MSTYSLLKWKSYNSTSKCYDGIFDLILKQNGLKTKSKFAITANNLKLCS